MTEAEDSAATAQAWLTSLSAANAGPLSIHATTATAPALASLVAGTLAAGRTLLLLCVDDEPLTGVSNAIDIATRPLCLVLPDAEYACRIAARATISLLKSRLARVGAETETPAWIEQRQRLDDAADTWHACLAWHARGLDGEAWPPALLEMFPIRVMPLPLARRLGASADWVVIVDASHQPEDARRPWPDSQRTLLLTGAPAPLPALIDTAARQRIELELLTQELAELELELATAQAEIADFTRRYHALIGTRMARLDELHSDLAARRAAADPEDFSAADAAASARMRAERSRAEHARFADFDAPRPPPFAPSSDVKKLYRKIAQKIHPDRAVSEDDRAWRTRLMAEANRAYAEGDTTALHEVLALWQEGTPAPAATGDDLAAQLERLRRRIRDIEDELNGLFGSKLYELFTACGIAHRAGRDLLQEMAERLDEDIAAVCAQVRRVS